MSLFAAAGFFLAFFFQLVTGFPLTPLALFWQVIALAQKEQMSELKELANAFFWAFLAGISMGVMIGGLLKWILLMMLCALLLVVMKNYIVALLTPITISFLLLCFLGILFIALGQTTFKMFAQYYSIYALAYFLPYALVSRQKNHQTRLF